MTEAAVQKILTGSFGDENTMMWRRGGMEGALSCRELILQTISAGFSC